jgi:hypothetical protein
MRYVYYQRLRSPAFIIIQHLCLCYYSQWCCFSSNHFTAVQVSVWYLHWLQHSARAAYLLPPMLAFLSLRAFSIPLRERTFGFCNLYKSALNCCPVVTFFYPITLINKKEEIWKSTTLKSGHFIMLHMM